MFQNHTYRLATALALIAVAISGASACSCVVITPAGAFQGIQGNISVHHVVVLSEFFGKNGTKSGPQNPRDIPPIPWYLESDDDTSHYFDVMILETFKGCDARPKRFLVQDKNFQNSCMSSLSVSKEYLLHLDTEAEVPSTFYCSGDRTYPLDNEWEDFLRENNECPCS